MKVKDLIGKIGFLDAYVKSEGTNKTYYHDYFDVVIHLITEVDGEKFEKNVWSSDGQNFGNGCSGINKFNEEDGCDDDIDIVPPKIKDYIVINIDFRCILDNSIKETSFGNEYRQKDCILQINVKN